MADGDRLLFPSGRRIILPDGRRKIATATNEDCGCCVFPSTCPASFLAATRVRLTFGMSPCNGVSASWASSCTFAEGSSCQVTTNANQSESWTPTDVSGAYVLFRVSEGFFERTFTFSNQIGLRTYNSSTIGPGAQNQFCSTYCGSECELTIVEEQRLIELRLRVQCNSSDGRISASAVAIVATFRNGQQQAGPSQQVFGGISAVGGNPYVLISNYFPTAQCLVPSPITFSSPCSGGGTELLGPQTYISSSGNGAVEVLP